MRVKTIKFLGIGLTVAAALAGTASADIIQEFVWVQGAPSSISASEKQQVLEANTLGAVSGGSLYYDITTKTVSDFSFSVIWGSTVDLFPGHPANVSDSTLSPMSGISTVINSGLDLILANPPGSIDGSPSGGVWTTTPQSGLSNWGLANENQFDLKFVISGDWVAQGMEINTSVPEPSTWIAGTSMLIPFGMSAFRVLRRKRTA